MNVSDKRRQQVKEAQQRYRDRVRQSPEYLAKQEEKRLKKERQLAEKEANRVRRKRGSLPPKGSQERRDFDAAEQRRRRSDGRYDEYVKQYRSDNKERAAELQRDWKKKNPERSKEINDNSRKKNADSHRLKSLQWQRDNPEKARDRNRRRVAKKRSNGGYLSSNIVDVLKSEQGEKCAYCMVDLSESGYHLDHFMPICLGGENSDDNVQLLCPACNCGKGGKHPHEFFEGLSK